MKRNFNANGDRLRGGRVKIYPTEAQKALLDKTISIYRKVYNIAMNIQEEDQSRYIPYYEMCKIMSNLVKTKEYEWLNQIPMSTIRQALVNLDNGYKKFFKKKANHPKFKSKRKSKKFFCCRSERTHAFDREIFISGIGFVDGKDHHIPQNTRLYNTSVHFDGYDYWFSYQIIKDKIDISDVPQTNIIGLDVGKRNLITSSEGDFYRFPKSIEKHKKKQKRIQRRLDKDYRKYMAKAKSTTTKYEDVPKSNNHYKRLKKLRKTYDKISHIRSNYLNCVTKSIVSKNPQAIVIEDIRVSDMIKQNPYLAKYVDLMPFYEIRRQIIYKAEDRNIPVIIADAHYPSTKKCSSCGFINNHIGSEKVYRCPICGLIIDRDLNAAYNLRDYGIAQMCNDCT